MATENRLIIDDRWDMNAQIPMNSNFDIGGGSGRLPKAFNAPKAVTDEQSAKNATTYCLLGSKNSAEQTEAESHPWMNGCARNYRNSIYFKGYVTDRNCRGYGRGRPIN